MTEDARAPHRVHLYATAIDNHGDIGVCWRLARQLAGEYDLAVHLWVDPWSAAQPLIRDLPDVPATTPVAGVVVRPWSHASIANDCTGDVLIEGFGCTLPAATLAQLAARANKPVWINLEYFSAEAWVERFHLGSSHDPAGGARRWFFFPGVHANSGGILRERGLLAARDAWQAGGHAAEFLARLGLANAGTLKVVCFAYAHAPYAEWLGALAASSDPPVALWLCGQYSQAAFRPAERAAHTNVAFHDVPFLPYTDFDRLLWSADVAIVRGEDSLTRALWSGRPFVWHIYPQDEGAHHAKLAAWVQFYARDFPPALAQAYVDLHGAWNGVPGAPALVGAWGRIMAMWPEWQAHSRARSDVCARSTDLAARLVAFVKTASQGSIQHGTYTDAHENSAGTT